MPKNNVILTGMPGSGKSTVGVILAKELCLKFLDVDVLIQTGENMTLQEIIDTRGLEAFLALEASYTMRLTVDNTVIAPGGSIVLSDQVMNALGKTGITVFLDVPLEIIKRRNTLFRMAGKGYVAGDLVVEAELQAMVIDDPQNGKNNNAT